MINKVIQIPLAAVVCLGLLSCESAWNRANQAGLKRDLQELFKKHGVVARDLDAQMLGATRAAVATFRAPVEQVPTLVQGLKLQAPAPDSGATQALEFREASAAGGCRSRPAFRDKAPTRVYLSKRRTEELRLSHGGAFEYMILYQRLSSEDVCVQVEYAYG